MPEKILIIDDDVETLRLVGIMLQKQGYEIQAASNGVQGIQAARETHPDLIVLDVMMPDLDGFEVTRQIRNQPDTLAIPILMFTAKGQVEDKVTGYDAGVDDYVTKPIHPAELVAHVKSLLARSRARGKTIPEERGYTLAVLAPRGGMGSSTIALNLAISYFQKEKRDVIAAELRPGHGTWGIELGFSESVGLSHLLRMIPPEITTQTVEAELTRTSFGPRLLLASNQIPEINLGSATQQMQAIVHAMSLMASLVILDIGSIIFPNYEQILGLCEEAIILTEPFPTAIAATQKFIDELKLIGFGRGKLLNLVLVNRIRADVQLTIAQVQDQLGLPVTQAIPPAPELSFNAAKRSLPICQVQPDGLISQQFNHLAEGLAKRIHHT